MPLPPDRLLRPSLRDFAPYTPGTSADEVRRRLGIERPVKLSQNENPLGTSPRALAALERCDELSVYADEEHLALRTKLAAPHGLSAANTILGHGSNELLQLAFLTLVDPGDEVVMAAPSFSLVRKDAAIFGALLREVPLRNGVHDLEAMLAAVTPRTKIVFVCDPNNPTGTRVEPRELAAFAEALPDDVLLLLDQAYREYMDEGGAEGTALIARRPATLVLRTASKIYGLAAVRFGYGFASPTVIEWLNRARLPFNVAAPAVRAVEAALDDREFVAASRENNQRGKAFLTTELRRLGVHAFPSDANFVALEVPGRADDAYRDLLTRGLIVRSGDGLGMPGRLRVSIGTPHDNARFIEIFEVLLPAWRGAAAGVAS